MVGATTSMSFIWLFEWIGNLVFTVMLVSAAATIDNAFKTLSLDSVRNYCFALLCCCVCRVHMRQIMSFKPQRKLISETLKIEKKLKNYYHQTVLVAARALLKLSN